MNAYDVIVLGLGATGSAAAYQLARRGSRVLGIDRHHPPHTHGSTHGDTRITRLAAGEGLQYSPLAIRSHEIWRQIESETGAELLTQNGGLIISTGGETPGLHGNAFFGTTIAAARKYGIAHEMLAAAEIRKRFPAFAVHDDEIGYFEPSAGFVRPEACVRAELDLARGHGAELRMGEEARFEIAPDHVRVTTASGTYKAQKLILAAGSWLPEFLSGPHPFKVYRQVMYWFDVRGAYEKFTPERFPIFIWQHRSQRRGFYGVPAIDGAGGGVKIATEQYDATTTPDSVARDIAPEEVAAMFETYVAPHFPDVRRDCLKYATCLYTVTPNGDFVIDVHPDSDRVIIASPCSGHGFKHSAALGEVLADLAETGRTAADIAAFRLPRAVGT